MDYREKRGKNLTKPEEQERGKNLSPRNRKA
jgi:hypothetical protein